MSRLVNLSDPVYAELTRIKRAKGQSYSEAIAGLLEKEMSGKKAYGMKEMNEWARAKARAYRGRKERIDYDAEIYGVSRDGA